MLVGVLSSNLAGDVVMTLTGLQLLGFPQISRWHPSNLEIREGNCTVIGGEPAKLRVI